MNVSPGDRFLFSYPRSGNTWLRHVLLDLAYQKLPAEYEELEDLMPTIDALEFKERVGKLPPELRLLKSHLQFAPYFLDGKIAYVVRDGRDVMISYYDYFKKLKGYGGSLDDFQQKFANGPLRYGTWHDNVRSWLDHVDHPNMMLIRFEDLRAGPLETVRQLAEFLSLPSDDKRLERALEASSVEKVHATMRSWVFTKGTEFKGGATSGGKTNWRDTLTQEQNEKFIEHAGDLLEALDYPLR